MKVYAITIKIFDGEEHYNDILLFENFDKAKQKFDEIIEDYRVSWENYNLIDLTETSLLAYDEGCYNDGNLLIDISAMDVN